MSGFMTDVGKVGICSSFKQSSDDTRWSMGHATNFVVEKMATKADICWCSGRCDDVMSVGGILEISGQLVHV